MRIGLIQFKVDTTTVAVDGDFRSNLHLLPIGNCGDRSSNDTEGGTSNLLDARILNLLELAVVRDRLESDSKRMYISRVASCFTSPWIFSGVGGRLLRHVLNIDALVAASS